MPPDNHCVREVIQEIVSAKTIGVDQVRTLEKYVKEDWVIDQEEAKLLFRVNHALGSDHDECDEWTQFFVTSIARLVVMDMNSPGEIDETEGDWLAEMLDEYSVENTSEKKLILEIQKCTTSIKGKLGERIQ